MGRITIHLTKSQEEFVDAFTAVAGSSKYSAVKSLFDLGCFTAEFIVDSKVHLIKKLKENELEST
jgi:hypothetical protein